MDGKERCSALPQGLVYPICVEIAEVWAFWMSVVTLGARSSLSVLGRHLASFVSDCSKGLLCIKAVSGGVKVGVVPRCKADRSPPESVQLISRRSNKTSFSFITVTKCRCKSIKMYSSNSIFFPLPTPGSCLRKYGAISRIPCTSVHVLEAGGDRPVELWHGAHSGDMQEHTTPRGPPRSHRVCWGSWGKAGGFGRVSSSWKHRGCCRWGSQ